MNHLPESQPYTAAGEQRNDGTRRAIRLPYGRSHRTLLVAQERLAGVLIPPGVDGAQTDAVACVRGALAQPIGSARLDEMARGKRNIVILTPDHTRPMPSATTLPLLLAQIRSGAPHARVTLLVATGVHRATQTAELRERFGDLAERYAAQIVVHDSDDNAQLVPLESLPSRAPLALHRLAMEADLLVAEGLIEPHFFAGFSGGRKAVLPGIAGRESVMANHSAALIAHPRARTGILTGNPIHADMVRAAAIARLAFVLNVVIDPAHQMAAAFAGAPDPAHAAGCEWLAARARVKPLSAPIVVTTNGGYPLDRDLYQTVKCMTAAEACCPPGGVIIAAACCQDGVGSEGMYRTFAQGDSDVAHSHGERPTPQAIAAAIAQRAMADTLPDQWQSQILARVLATHTVVVVSDLPAATISAMGMVPARDLAHALATAERIVGQDAQVLVIPDGVGIVVR